MFSNPAVQSFVFSSEGKWIINELNGSHFKSYTPGKTSRDEGQMYSLVKEKHEKIITFRIGN